MIKKKAKLILILLLLPLLFSCKYTPDISSHYTITENWMALLPDNTPLRSITIPGTHDTCALMDFMLNDTSNNQVANLPQQLDMGVRFIDLRLHKNNDGTVGLYHGIKYMYINFDNVMEFLKAFLDKNPTETIICMVKEEVFLSSGDGLSFVKDIDSLISSSRYKDYFYISSDNKFPETLGETRGKIILMRNYAGTVFPEIGIDMYRKNISDQFVNLTSGYYVPYHDERTGVSIETPEDKLEWAEKEVDYLVANPPSVITMLNLNAYKQGPFGLPDIGAVARVVNAGLKRKLNEYINKGEKHQLGIFYIDKIDPDFAYALIRMNEGIN